MFDLFDKYGSDNCQIVLIKQYDCESRKDLEKEEGKYISQHDCINKNISGRSFNQYLIDNKEKIRNHKNQVCKCICGCNYTHNHKSRHIRTNIHQTYLIKTDKLQIILAKDAELTKAINDTNEKYKKLFS